MKYELSISTNYVSKWGRWEAVRELLQNAYDQRDRDSDCIVTFEYTNGVLLIGTSTGKLEPKTLLLGETDKAGEPGLRGKFGEGYKLALLVLCRLGHKVLIANGGDFWTPAIERSETFGTDVLTIHSDPGESKPGVRVVINGITLEQWQEISKNVWRTARRDKDEVILIPEEKGRIYVGGLFVCHMNLDHGYSFRVETVVLDRDRGMVNEFDITLETSRLWLANKESAYSLLLRESPDIRYADSIYDQPAAVKQVYDTFVEKHGRLTIPVSTQEEVQRAQAAGVKWTLIPKILLSLLKRVTTWFIPDSKPPIERLRLFYKTNLYSLSEEARVELLDIINKLDPQEIGDMDTSKPVEIG